MGHAQLQYGLRTVSAHGGSYIVIREVGEWWRDLDRPTAFVVSNSGGQIVKPRLPRCAVHLDHRAHEPRWDVAGHTRSDGSFRLFMKFSASVSKASLSYSSS